MSAATESQRPVDAITAEVLFAATRALGCADDRMLDAVIRALGADPRDPDGWPVDDFVYDDYDESIELVARDVEWRPDLSGIWQLGFSRAWVRYPDGTERIAAPAYPLGDTMPTSEGRRVRDDRVRVAVKSLAARLTALERERDELRKAANEAIGWLTAMLERREYDADHELRDLQDMLARAALTSSRETTDGK